MITKRQKITISSCLLAIGLFFIPVLPNDLKLPFILCLVLASYLLSVWSIYSNFSGFELIALFVLPTILTASFAIFMSRFYISTGVKSILAVVYVVVMYTILLSENIFNVSLERNIPLVRAARTIGYLSTLFVSFAFFTLLFGLGLNVFVFFILSFLVASLLFLQGLWQIELKQSDLKKISLFSLVAGFIVGELAFVFGFWPLSPPKIGLAITASVYVLLGVIQHHLREDLNKQTIAEYLLLSAFIIIFLVLTTSWGV